MSHERIAVSKLRLEEISKRVCVAREERKVQTKAKRDGK